MIFATFTVLAALCLLALVYSRLHWSFKVALIVVTFAFCFLVWSAQDSRQGWPSARAFPNNAEFVSCVVMEPNDSQGIVGAIYLWLIPLKPSQAGLFTYTPSLYEPRAYQEPYSEDLQAACQQAQKMQAGGQGVQLVKSPGHRGGVDGQGVLIPGRYHAYQLPPVALPKKAH